jgi:threonine dehydrogenase-like Zn-dependent dehydrogenase
MKAVHLAGKGKIEIAEYPMPELKEDQVLVKVTASGVCGSEMGAARSDSGHAMNPGHEVTGIIADPNGHAQWQEGDRVIIFTLQGCGDCAWCRSGRDTFCSQVTTPSSTHAEYCSSRAHAMVKVPEGISDEVAVLLGGDGLGVPYGASTRAGVKAGDITCVLGCGPVGLGNVLVHAHLGAFVIAVEPSEARRELALKMGAWKAIDPTACDDLRGTLRTLADGIGPDKCFECSGRQDTLDVAMDVTRPEGTIMLIGHGKQSIDPQKLIIKHNHTMMGNWVAHPGWYPGMLQMVRDGLDLGRLITAVYPYEDAQKAYDEMLAGTCGKIILKWA